MAKKVVTLYIDDTSLRVMVTQDRRIREWAEMPLEPGLIDKNVVTDEAAVVAKIKELFKTQNITAKNITVGMSGLHCLTRPITLPQLPKEMLDEAVKREARRTLPVPVEQLYLSWQTIPAPEDKTQVFLSAIPNKTADALLKALQRAGLKPSFMDLKPLLLARVAKEATAIIVDVQTSEFDIVIMTDGVPQPIRTIPFPYEALSLQENLSMIRDELNRTITFYDSNNPEKPLAAEVPVLASGELAGDAGLCQALSDEIGHPVLPLTSPLECPEGFAPSRYMVNIGLAVQALSSAKEAVPSIINLNALPAAYLPKPISLINILALPGAVIAAGFLIILAILTQNASADIASIRAELDTTNQLLQQKLAARQELTANATALEKKFTAIGTSRDNLTAVLGSLEQQSAGINQDLKVTIESLSGNITLSSINHANNRLTITGIAPSEKRVVLYLTQLDNSGRFGDITIMDMGRIEGEGINFTLLGTLQTQIYGVSTMEVVLGSLPTGITLTSVNCAEDTLIINGTSLNEDKVLLYLRALEASGKLNEITISRMTRTEEGGIDFSLILKTGE